MSRDTGSPFDGNMIVKNVLHRYKIKQTELCERLGYSREAFSKIVNGHRALSVAKAKEISDAYNLDWRSFYEAPSDRFVPATACIDQIKVRPLKQTWLVKCPKEWHNNSEFYVICDPGREFTEYVYVISNNPIEFAFDKLLSPWTLFTLKDQTKLIGYADGYMDDSGKNIRIWNVETKGVLIVPTKKITHMQKARALLPPNN
tara:strand:- start:173 stop:778 length:606 start_codon:yes stop_codon:yes gene_type:complete